ncbi:MAG: glycosyltransferase family 4 protein [Candidatus Kerfeldbacteria bacterium]|nr:glycosyltransferase family 4 protein [Candidatus Kerfeldbacteria bacterium]
MKIGIDARFYGTGAKGLGRYTEKLVTHLEKIDDHNEYVIFLRKENWDEYTPRNPRFEKRLANFRWYTIIEQIWLPWVLWRARLDLMHFPHFNVPLLYRRPFVVTIHDLILTKYPTQRATTLGPLLYRIKHWAYHIIIRRAVRQARRIIAVSKYTKQEIVHHFGVDPQHISVTYEAVDTPMQEAASDLNVLEQYSIKQPYILYVGNVYPHKNSEGLIEAFIQLRQTHPNVQLVLVGRQDYFVKRLQKIVEASGIAHAVRFTGYVPDGELPSLYRHAAAYVFPSFCEGFGLPGLEACAFGVPVAASDNSCLPEILGDAALYFDPHNHEDIARQVSVLLDNAHVAADMRERGYKRIRQFSWDIMAERTRDLYEAA